MVGFYEPIFGPAFGIGVDAIDHLSITRLEQVRDAVVPRASLHSTAVAAIGLSQRPIAFVCAKPERRGGTTSLVIQSVALSGAAVNSSWNLVPNMVVCPRSCMSDAMRDATGHEVSQRESQSRWMHPRGVRCRPTVATISAAQRGPVVYALVDGGGVERSKEMRPQSQHMVTACDLPRGRQLG
jgi:hypothetical protein